MLMWEITSHEIPFSDKSIGEVYTLLKNSDGGAKDYPRPSMISGTPEKYASIMQKCWRQVPELRPTMEYITIKLENLEKTYDNAFEYASDTAATEIRKQLP